MRTALAILALEAVAFPITRAFGLYGKYWFTDDILHVLAGAMFASLWLWLIRLEPVSAKARYASALTAAVFGSFLWEVWEFGGSKVVSWATAYVPELSDTLADMSFGLLGGVILIICDRLLKR